MNENENEPINVKSPFKKKKEIIKKSIEIDPFIRSTIELKEDGKKTLTSFLNSFDKVDAIVGPHRAKKKCLATIIEMNMNITKLPERYSPISIRILKYMNGKKQRSYYTSWRWALLRGIRKTTKSELECLTVLEMHMKKRVPVSKDQVAILFELRTNYENAKGKRVSIECRLMCILLLCILE